MVTGKIIITKKSGPGELTGVTEIELTDSTNTGTTNATFKGLQFTEGGDYVLSITSTSPDIEPKEIKISVIKEDDIVAQPQSKGNNTEEKPVDSNRPIIAQIDKPTIKVPAIKMQQDSVAGVNGQSNYTQGLGYTPLIWYKAYAIEERYITNLRLYHDGLIPKIEFTFKDTKDILKGIGTPTDDSTIDLFLNSTSNNLKSIHLVFKIESYDQGRETENGQNHTIVGTMNIPNLYLVSNKSYNDTSFNTLRKICSELEIGFNSNISNTEDKMPWKNPNKKIFNFMEDIIARSYINDESFMGGYIDYYYCFNYVDIEKEMNRDNSKDMGIDTSSLSQQSQPDENLRIMPLILTNDKSQSNSSNYISSVIKVNDSTRKSLTEGYATVTKYYDRNKKQFLVFTVDSTTSDGSKSIILKGAENDDKYQKANVKHQFAGKIDTDNVHSNFNYASTQNRINLNNLNKIALNVTLPNANWNLYKFQKVNVQIINQSSTPANPSPVDFRYSGSYIIADIEYIWSKGRMSQNLRLVRKELGKTPDEVKNSPPVKAKPETKENNLNPVDNNTQTSQPAPNSVYNVGQVYLVQNNNSKLYNIEVSKLLEDGIQLTGTLTESPIKSNSSQVGQTTFETFNVERKDTFVIVSGSQSGIQYTIVPNDGKTYITNEDLNNGLIDDLGEEYSESEFQGTEEDLFKFNDPVSYGRVDIDAINSIKGYDPENPNPTLSTDTNAKYPVSKNKDANIKSIINAAKSAGVTNKYAISAILAIVSKESGFIPHSESSYAGTPASRIKSIFAKFRGYSDSEVDVIKKDPVRFFDIIYGGKYGNSSTEGFKYRGRGFNQITFKGNYAKYAKDTGLNIVNDPDLLNTVDAAAKCVIAFFKSGVNSAPASMKKMYNFTNINSFTNLDDATGAIYHANAGWGKSYSEVVADSTGGRKKAFTAAGPLYNTYQSQIA